jgi:hypothetical protein
MIFTAGLVTIFSPHAAIFGYSEISTSNVSYSLLKRYYSNRILLLAYSYIYYINKETFLLAFKVAFKKAFTLKNISIEF